MADRETVDELWRLSCSLDVAILAVQDEEPNAMDSVRCALRRLDALVDECGPRIPTPDEDEPTPAQLQAAREQLGPEPTLMSPLANDLWCIAVRERALRLAAEERHSAELARERQIAKDNDGSYYIARDALENTRADLRVARRDHANVCTELAAMREAWTNAREACLRAERERDALRTELAAMRKRAEAAEQARAVTQRQFDEMSDQRDTLRTEVARLTEALERERIERQAAEARVAQFEDEAWDELMGM